MFTDNPKHLDHKDLGELRQKNKIDEILKGEISAFEAYQKVIENLADDPREKVLIKLFEDHRKAASYWRTLSAENNFNPIETSGLWGKVVGAVVVTSRFFGGETCLRTLLEGEEYGLVEYRKLLASSSMPPNLKDEIEKKFIPTQKRHISILNKMIRFHH